MIKGIKKSLAVIAALAMTAGCFAGCSAEVIDSAETVVVVDGEEVPMGVASIYARYQQAQMFTMYSQYLGTTQIFSQVTAEDSNVTFGDQMKDDIMEFLVDMYVLKSHAEEMDITLTEDEVAEIAATAKSFAEANDASVLREIGTTEANVAELLELYAYHSKMYDAMVADVDTEVSDEEAAQSKMTYVTISLAGTTDADGNTVELTDAEKAAKEELAQSVLDKIMASDDVAAADMDALAKEVDETLSATEYTFDDEDTYIDAAVLEAVDGLKDGEMVESVVTSSDGTLLYVIRFDAELDRDATDAEKSNIVYQRQQDAYSAKLEEWKSAAEYEVKEEVWDQISINDTNIYTFKTAEETVQ